MPVLGVLHRDDGISAPSRHLGLVPGRRTGRRGAGSWTGWPRRSPSGSTWPRWSGSPAPRPISRPEPWDPVRALAPWLPDGRCDGPEPVVAIAGGRAFTFRYPETDELLLAAGCRPVVFDPVEADALPDNTSGVYLGGGFPEVHASGAGRQPRDARRAGRCDRRRASPRSPNAPGCCTCPGRSTAPPWWARWTPTP